MKLFYDERQALHAPIRELHNGDWVPFAETPERLSSVIAICGPPGHHAGRDYMGGYCYLNHAAIAAAQAHSLGFGPVAVFDVDYHHGNGSQDIFLEDPTIFFASIHADPATDCPFYWRHADERGQGEGIGTTLNLPLPRGTTWKEYSPALDSALEGIAVWGAAMLIVSFGADTYAEDPVSHFNLQRDDFERLANAIGSLCLPTLTVLEGGYVTDSLGANVATFLSGFE